MYIESWDELFLGCLIIGTVRAGTVRRCSEVQEIFAEFILSSSPMALLIGLSRDIKIQNRNVLNGVVEQLMGCKPKEYSMLYTEN